MTLATTNHTVKRQQNGMLAIQLIVAQHYGYTVKELLAKCRTAHLAFSRQVAMALCRWHTAASYPDIAKVFDKKNHMTVMHACRNVEARKKASLFVCHEINALEKQVAKALQAA